MIETKIVCDVCGKSIFSDYWEAHFKDQPYGGLGSTNRPWSMRPINDYRHICDNCMSKITKPCDDETPPEKCEICGSEMKKECSNHCREFRGECVHD